MIATPYCFCYSYTLETLLGSAACDSLPCKEFAHIAWYLPSIAPSILIHLKVPISSTSQLTFDHSGNSVSS